MNKNLRTIIILLVVLALCVGGFIFISKLIDKQEAQDALDAEESIINIGDIVDGLYIGITTNAGSMEFVSDGENWKYYQDENFPLKESYMTDIIDAAVGLTAFREIEAVDDLSAYGLDDGSYLTLMIIDSENNVFVLDIGYPISDGSAWYARDPSLNTIYIISDELPNAVNFSLYDMIDMENFGSFDAEDVKSISIVSGEAKLSYKQETVTSEMATGEIDEDTGEQIYEENILSTWYDITGEEPVLINDITTPSLLAETAAGFEFTACMNYDASEGLLQSSGLSDPSMTITVVWTDISGAEASETLVVGRSDGNGSYWVKLASSNALYTISETYITPFVNVISEVNE